MTSECRQGLKERGGSPGGTDQRIKIPPFDAVTGVPALITLA
jgi:hypothetical protein